MMWEATILSVYIMQGVGNILICNICKANVIG